MSIQSRINNFIINPKSDENRGNITLEGPLEERFENGEFTASYLNHPDFLKGLLKGEQRLANNDPSQAINNLEFDAYYSEAAYLFCLSLPIDFNTDQILQLKNAGVYNLPYALVLYIGALESAIRSNKKANETYVSNLSSKTLLANNNIPDKNFTKENIVPQQVIYKPSGELNFFLSSYGTYDNIIAYFYNFLYGEESDLDYSKESVVYNLAKEGKISIFKSFENNYDDGIDFFGAYKVTKYSKSPLNVKFEEAENIEELIFKFIGAYFDKKDNEDLNEKFINRAKNILDKDEEETIKYLYYYYVGIPQPNDLSKQTLISLLLNRQERKFLSVPTESNSEFEINIFPSCFGCIGINSDTKTINDFFTPNVSRELETPENYGIRKNNEYSRAAQDLPSGAHFEKNPTLWSVAGNYRVAAQNKIQSDLLGILGYSNVLPHKYQKTIPSANKLSDLKTDSALYLSTLSDEIRSFCLTEFEKFSSARNNSFTFSQSFNLKSIIKALMTIEYEDLSDVEVNDKDQTTQNISAPTQADLLAFWDSYQAIGEKGLAIGFLEIDGDDLNAFITNAQFNKAKKIISEFLDEEVTVNIRTAANTTVENNNIANSLFEPKIFFTEKLDSPKIDQMEDIEFLRTVCFNTKESDITETADAFQNNKETISREVPQEQITLDFSETIAEGITNENVREVFLHREEYYTQPARNAIFNMIGGSQSITNFKATLDRDISSVRLKDLDHLDAESMIDFLLVQKLRVKPSKANINGGSQFINYFIYLTISEIVNFIKEKAKAYPQKIEIKYKLEKDNFVSATLQGVVSEPVEFVTFLSSIVYEGTEDFLTTESYGGFALEFSKSISELPYLNQIDEELIPVINVFNNFKLKDAIEISEEEATDIKETAFKKFEEDIKNFVIRSKKATDSFVSGFQSELQAHLKGEDEKDKEEKKQDNKSNSSTNSDDLRFRTYYNMKNLYDSWISFAGGEKDENDNVRLFFNYNGVDTCNEDMSENYTNKDLIDYFSFIDRAGKDIGTEAKVDLHFLLRYFGENLDSSNLNTSLHSFLDTFLNHHGFRFHALPYYIPLGAYDTEDLANVFTPIHDTKVNEKAGPAYVCQYLGDASSKPFTKQASETNAVSKSFCLDDDSGTDVPNDMKNGVASSFIVDFGTNENMIFNGVKLDQSEFMNTEESFDVITNMTKNYATTTGSNLYKVYTSRSYTAQVQTLGNMMIQPLMFFYLKNVPIFEGSYWITNVSHSIQQNQMSTEFKGVRQPQSVLPSPSETFISLNEDFVEIYGVNVGVSLVEDAQEIRNLERGELSEFLKKIADKESRGNGDWRAINELGFIGRYQFGMATLAGVLEGSLNMRKAVADNVPEVDNSQAIIGEYVPSTQEIANEDVENPIELDFNTILLPSKWENMDKAEKEGAFPPGLQDLIMIQNLKDNLQYLENQHGDLESVIGEIRKGVPITKSGLLGAAHLGGAGAANKIIRNDLDDLETDANETSPFEYFKIFGGFNLEKLKTDEFTTVKQAKIDITYADV